MYLHPADRPVAGYFEAVEPVTGAGGVDICDIGRLVDTAGVDPRGVDLEWRLRLRSGDPESSHHRTPDRHAEKARDAWIVQPLHRRCQRNMVFPDLLAGRRGERVPGGCRIPLDEIAPGPARPHGALSDSYPASLHRPDHSFR